MPIIFIRLKSMRYDFRVCYGFLNVRKFGESVEPMLRTRSLASPGKVVSFEWQVAKG